MGRAKVKYELIGKERSRNITFLKRKKGLIKKTYEFSTLCGVDACLIVYPMKGTGLNEEAETWPEKREDVLHIIDQFRNRNCTATDGRGINRHIGVPEFFEDQIKKLGRELTELRQQNIKTKYPTWDDRLNNLSTDQLKNLAASLDSKMEFVKARIDLDEGGNHNYYVSDDAVTGLNAMININRGGNHDFVLDDDFTGLNAIIDLDEGGNYLDYVLDDDVAGLIEYSVPPLNQNSPLPLPLSAAPYRDSYSSSSTMDHNMQMQMQMMNHCHHQPCYPLDSSLMINGMNGMGNCYGTSSTGNIPYHPSAMVAPISNQMCYNSKFPTVDEMTMINKPCYFPPPCYAQQLNQTDDFSDLQDYHRLAWYSG